MISSKEDYIEVMAYFEGLFSSYKLAILDLLDTSYRLFGQYIS